MLVLADIGTATALLERLATSIVAGTVVAGFVAAGREMLSGRERSALQVSAVTGTFWGGLTGCFCLLYDLVLR
jgi:hypothetical protein